MCVLCMVRVCEEREEKTIGEPTQLKNRSPRPPPTHDHPPPPVFLLHGEMKIEGVEVGTEGEGPYFTLIEFSCFCFWIFSTAGVCAFVTCFPLLLNHSGPITFERPREVGAERPSGNHALTTRNPATACRVSCAAGTGEEQQLKRIEPR